MERYLIVGQQTMYSVQLIPLAEGDDEDTENVLVIDGGKMFLDRIELVDAPDNYEGIKNPSGERRHIYPLNRWGEEIVPIPGDGNEDVFYGGLLAPNSLYSLVNDLNPRVFPALFELLLGGWESRPAWNHIGALFDMGIDRLEEANERIRRVMNYLQEGLKKSPWLPNESKWKSIREKEILGKEPQNLAEYTARLFLEDVEGGSL